MTMTIHDIYERLKQVDEISLLELLDISSEDLVDRFQDLIEDRADELAIEFEDERDQDTFDE